MESSSRESHLHEYLGTGTSSYSRPRRPPTCRERCVTDSSGECGCQDKDGGEAECLVCAVCDVGGILDLGSMGAILHETGKIIFPWYFHRISMAYATGPGS